MDATGPMGPTGPAGATGERQGASVTVLEGTVRTGVAGSSAAVSNSGRSSGAFLNVTIPRGNVGLGYLAFCGTCAVVSCGGNGATDTTESTSYTQIIPGGTPSANGWLEIETDWDCPPPIAKNRYVKFGGLAFTSAFSISRNQASARVKIII